MSAEPGITTVIFDLGGVVLNWELERALAHVLTAEQIAPFLERIDFSIWNRRLDAGLSFESGEAELIRKFPEDELAILSYRRYFGDTLTGMVDGTGAVIAELQRAGTRLLGLTNWSADTFPVALQKFGLLRRLESIVVSGEVGMAKPDPAIFELLATRFQVTPTECVFIDDSPMNVAAAERLGFVSVQFTDAAQLRQRLQDLGLLQPRQKLFEPVYHVTDTARWRSAQRLGAYEWSSRYSTYAAQGFVQCSFEEQVAGTVSRHYSDVSPADIVILELDPSPGKWPIVIEKASGGHNYPHLYAELPVADVTAERNWLPVGSG